MESTGACVDAPVDDPQGVHSAKHCRERSGSVRCPYCAADEDRVIDSRPVEDARAIRRRRRCLACDQRFSTYERIEHAPLWVRKRSGDVQPFDARRIVDGMAKAATALDLDDHALQRAAAQVEARVRAAYAGEVPSEAIGSEVLAALRALHHVAYVRFASVYKGFTSTDDFVRELASLGESPPQT